MANFTVRVELHHSDDYDTLHEEMEAEGFSRTIRDGKGSAYHLPTAEYVIGGNLTRAGVLAKAKRAAGKTKKKFSILVTESKARTWVGLDKADA